MAISKKYEPFCNFKNALLETGMSMAARYFG